MIKKSALYICSLIILVFLCSLLISTRINFEAIYLQFQNEIQKFGYDVQTSTIEVTHFPTPQVTLQNVEIPGIFKSKNLVVKFSFFSMLRFNPQISKIEINQAELKASGGTILHHPKALSKIYQLLSIIPNADIYDIKFTDRQYNNILLISNIEVRPKSSENQLAINWTDNNISYISYNKIDKDNLEVIINTMSPSYKSKIQETYDKNFTLLNGVIKYDLSDISEYINTNFGYSNNKFPQDRAIISANIKSVGEDMQIYDIKIISSFAECDGSFNVSDNNESNALDLHFTKLDLSHFINNIDLNAENNNRQIRLDRAFKFAFNIDSVKLNQSVFNEVKLNGTNEHSILSINQFNGKMNFDDKETGSFDITGNLANNNFRWKFVGAVNFNYPDFNTILAKIAGKELESLASKQSIQFSSSLESTTINYRMTNIISKIGEVATNGNINVNLIGTTPRIDLDLQFSSVDFDKTEFPFLKQVVSYFSSLNENTYKDNYLQQYVALRNMKFLSNVDLDFINPVIKGVSADRLHLICRTSYGLVNCDSVYYQNGSNNLNGSLNLVATGIKPLLSLKIENGQINLQDSDISTDKIISLLNNLGTKYDLTKLVLDASINLKLLQNNNTKFDNLYFALQNDNSLLNISSLQFNYNNSGFQSSGSLSLNPIKINLGYSWNNFNIEDLKKIYPINIFYLQSGWFSMNGTLFSHGYDLNEMIYYLSMQSDIVGTSLVWNNYNIDKFITNSWGPHYDYKNLKSDASNVFSSGASNIEKITGKYSLDNGIFTLKDMIFNTSKSDGKLNGTFDIYKTMIDVKIENTFSQDSESSNKAIGIYNSSTLKSRIYGTMPDASIDVDVSKIKPIKRNIQN